jgi:nucleoside-diphosphate-sugar epimerase
MHKKVLITGASGFLGSHIAEKFLIQGWKVIGLKRISSNLWRCEDFVDQIEWLDVDSEKFSEQIIDLCPDVIIHSAWGGVAANDRVQYKPQLNNLKLLLDLLNIANAVKCKFIGLGSQAEYGTFFGKIDEQYPVDPNTAYGVVKLMSCSLVRGFCNANELDWFWLRLFPVFGEKEDDNWLIPSVIKKVALGAEMELTPGLQRYAYIYVKDLSACVFKIASLYLSKSVSGIYNISGEGAITLRELVEKIRDAVDVKVKLNFGALNYRPYQSMYMEGDTTKFSQNINKIIFSDFNESLNKTIQYYLAK